MNPVRTRILGLSVVAIASLSLTACGGEENTALASTNAASETPTTIAGQTPTTAAAAPVLLKLVSDEKLGPIVRDANGNTLYAFTKDSDGKSTCNDACAVAWPPARVADASLNSEGIDQSLLSTITRDDGTTQLALNKWPLYRFAADGEGTGTTKGQGNKDVWFVLDAQGKLNKTGSAAAATTVAPPAPAAGSSTASSPSKAVSPAVVGVLTPTAVGSVVGAATPKAVESNKDKVRKGNDNRKSDDNKRHSKSEQSSKKNNKRTMFFFNRNKHSNKHN